MRYLWGLYWKVFVRKPIKLHFIATRNLHEEAMLDFGYEPSSVEFANWCRAHWDNPKMDIH